MKSKTLRKFLVFISLAFVFLVIATGSFYTYWNTASPEKTCASCHEIQSAVTLHTQSPHRELQCMECHGTALSNGIHSIREKGMMVVHHLSNKVPEDIRLNETQMLAVMDNCTRCHTTEYARWRSGGHSATYGHILLDTTHNQTEQLNFDCLRCHGMFSDLSIHDLVEPINTLGPWTLKSDALHDKPAIPCMACHLVHRTGSPSFSPDYANPGHIFYQRPENDARAGFYSRGDRSFVPAQNLPKLQLHEGDRLVNVSDDPLMRICIQCHAPNALHLAGTSDDRTPRGVHEGLSCLACHDPHSNDARQSCIKCHPAISNCGQDVTTMNTSYAHAESPNNIHWVGCTSCHETGAPKISKNKVSYTNPASLK